MTEYKAKHFVLGERYSSDIPTTNHNIELALDIIENHIVSRDVAKIIVEFCLDTISIYSKRTFEQLKYHTSVELSEEIWHLSFIPSQILSMEFHCHMLRNFPSHNKLQRVTIKNFFEEHNSRAIKLIKQISALPNLRKLHIEDIDLRNVDEDLISNNLQELSLIYCNLENLSLLSKLKNITCLDISSNKITDFSPLANLPKLRHLFMVDNDLSKHNAVHIPVKPDCVIYMDLCRCIKTPSETINII